MQSSDRFVYGAKVVRWVDGDTVILDWDLGAGIWFRKQSFRLYGIDTPELRPKKAGRTAESLAAEKTAAKAAQSRARELAPLGSHVTIRTYKDKTGKFGRWLADIYVHGEERSINEILIEEGHAEEASY